MGVERGQHRVALGLQQAAHAVDVGSKPSALGIPVHGHGGELTDGTYALEGHHPIHERRGGRHVTGPHARSYVLRERGDVDRAAAVVERPDRRRHLLPLEGQVDVAVVLPHRHAVAGADLAHRFAPGHRLHPAERVLKGRHRVHRLDALAVVQCDLHLVLERVGQHALVVRLDAADVGAEAAQDAERAGIGEVLDQHHVAGIDQRLRDQEVGLARPGAQEDAVGVHRESARLGKP